jgi:hypothetical protein
MEMEHVSMLALAVVGALELAAAAPSPSHPKDASMPIRYLLAPFLLINEVGDMCRCVHNLFIVP